MIFLYLFEIYINFLTFLGHFVLKKLNRFLRLIQTYISLKELNISKLSLSQVSPLQMCVKRKNREDITIFDDTLFEKFWLYIPRRLYSIQARPQSRYYY